MLAKLLFVLNGSTWNQFCGQGNTNSDCFKPGLLEFTRIEKNTCLFKPIKAVDEIEGEGRNQSVPNYKIATSGGRVKLLK